MNTSGRLCAIALLSWSLACAGGSGGITKDHGTAEMEKPSVVLIYPFGFSPEIVKVDTALLEGNRPPSKAEREDLGRAVAAAVARQLVEELQAAGIRARRSDASMGLPPGAISVKGRFTKIDQGDQAARVAVGMGAGVEKIEVRLEVEQATASGVRPLTEEFHEAHGDKMPGMVVSVGTGAATGSVASSLALGAVEKGVTESLGGLDAAVDDLVDHLVEGTVKFYQRRGWLE